MTNTRGKSFEGELVAAFRLRFPSAFVKRFTDAVFGNGRMSQKSPPDLLVLATDEPFEEGFNLIPASAWTHRYLIECKALKLQPTGNGSIPFDRLAAHQLDELVAFTGADSSHKAFVAVNFYNGTRGRKGINRAFLVPVSWWVEQAALGLRKSVSLVQIDGDPSCLECVWVPGKGWLLPF